MRNGYRIRQGPLEYIAVRATEMFIGSQKKQASTAHGFLGLRVEMINQADDHGPRLAPSQVLEKFPVEGTARAVCDHDQGGGLVNPLIQRLHRVRQKFNLVEVFVQVTFQRQDFFNVSADDQGTFIQFFAWEGHQFPIVTNAGFA